MEVSPKKLITRSGCEQCNQTTRGKEKLPGLLLFFVILRCLIQQQANAWAYEGWACLGSSGTG
jgi:hypothetical protein